jgi:hypothetical protein
MGRASGELQLSKENNAPAQDAFAVPLEYDHPLCGNE